MQGPRRDRLRDENATLRQVADAYTAEAGKSWEQRWSERMNRVASEWETACTQRDDAEARAARAEAEVERLKAAVVDEWSRNPVNQVARRDEVDVDALENIEYTAAVVSVTDDKENR